MKKLFLNLIVCCLAMMLDAQDGHAQEPTNPWNAKPDPEKPVTYQNPVIPGFYSDPSVCRVGDDYYLVTSTFEFFPGVPVFHSKDLVNWNQIGHCIHRPEQLPNGINIFAATLRYYNGTFYMITTNVVDGGNFYVTSEDPEGPWSDPIWVDVGGIDPDLYFESGRAYVISSTFEMTEIDPVTGELIGEKRKVWNGAGGRYAEAPHIYKKDGYYYLMAAEGGTEEAHSVTIARSHNLWGPYTDNPANPILAHANAGGQGNPIQGVGHADMIQAHDDSWWILFHGYRDIVGYPVHHVLGRETCLAPVTWPERGWPVVYGSGVVDVDMVTPTLPLSPFPEKPSRVEFDRELGHEWNYIQAPDDQNYSLNTKQSRLSLTGSALKIGDSGSPTFIGRRLTDMNWAASVQLDFDPTRENEEAGLSLLNNGSHFDLLVAREEQQRVVYARLQFGPTVYYSEKFPLQAGPVELKVTGQKAALRFSFAQGGKDYIEIDSADARFLSTETVGWFTGVYVGLYATGNGEESQAEAIYDWFHYEGK